jgi:type IV pilus assembly protein PilQ
MRSVVGLLLLVLSLAATPHPEEAEAHISLDVKDAPIEDIVRLLAEVGDFQVVFDPGLSCKLTVKLTEVRWQSALDVSLRTCGLGREEENGILRIATVSRLSEESAARRRLQEEQQLSAPKSVAHFRLSYARAQEMAPLVRRLLSARGEVVFDARTNTLIVID